MKKIVLLSLLLLAKSFIIIAQETTDDTLIQEEIPENVKHLQTVAKDGILVFTSATAKFKVWFDVRVQADGAVFFGAPTYADKIGNGMSIRRSRFAIRAQLDKNWYGEVDTDWTSGRPEIRDAIIAFNGVKGLDIRAGHFKENFSLQLNTSSRYIMFMERPMVTSLAPSRHLGINATYGYKWLWTSAGVFGPALSDTETMRQMQAYNTNHGMSEGLSYTGKLVYRPLYKSESSSLHIGGAFSYRNNKTTNFDLGDFENLLNDSDIKEAIENGQFNKFDVLGSSMNSRNSTSINRKKYLNTGNLIGVDYETVWTAELVGHWKGFRGETAYIARTAHMDPAVNAVVYSANPFIKFTGDGWYVQASYLLFGGNHVYDLEEAKYMHVNKGKKWGDIEVAARFQTFDLNDGPITGGKANMYELGLNYYAGRNVKIMLNYSFIDQDKYANGSGEDKGSFIIGLKDGIKTAKSSELNTKGMKGGVDYQMLAIRFQVIF